MTEKQTTIYKCGYCSKWYQRKNHCLKHEQLCFHNPENKIACSSCIYLTKKDAKIEMYEGVRKVNCFYCSKKESFLYLPQNKIKGNYFDLGDSSEVMPKECEFFKNHYEHTDIAIEPEFKEKFEKMMNDLNVF